MRKLAAFLVVSICLWAPAGLMPAADQATGVTAEEAIRSLTKGNARFAEGKSTHPNADSARRTETAQSGQRPLATVLACANSRSPVEIVFDRGIGDLFVVRVAGNVCGVDEQGSIEYGVEKLGTPLVLVLGHSDCGAVSAAVSGAELHGSIKRLVGKIVPAVVDAQSGAAGAARQGAFAGGHGGERVALDRGAAAGQSDDAALRTVGQAQGARRDLQPGERESRVARRASEAEAVARSRALSEKLPVFC